MVHIQNYVLKKAFAKCFSFLKKSSRTTHFIAIYKINIVKMKFNSYIIHFTFPMKIHVSGIEDMAKILTSSREVCLTAKSWIPREFMLARICPKITLGGSLATWNWIVLLCTWRLARWGNREATNATPASIFSLRAKNKETEYPLPYLEKVEHYNKKYF